MSDKTIAEPPRGYGLLTATEYRNQIIQELIEKAETECKNLETKHSRIGHIRVERDVVGRTMLEREINALWRTSKWLKSQMEGGE